MLLKRAIIILWNIITYITKFLNVWMQQWGKIPFKFYDCILQNSRCYSLDDHNKEFFLKSKQRI